MSEKENKQEYNIDESFTLTTDVNNRISLPFQMEWQPKEDITAYELAMCMPYFFSAPYKVDTSLPHFRHFKITDPNK